MKRLALGILISALPILARAQDPDPGVAAVVGLAPQIETVASGGYWEANGKEGSYRVIILLDGWEHLSNRVFLQWVEVDQEKQEFHSLRIIPIPEVSEGRWRVTEAKFELVGEQWRIVLPARGQDVDRKATLTVVPAADFTYKMLQ